MAKIKKPARARTKAAKAEWLKTYLKSYMELMDRTKGGTTLKSARIQKNSQPTIRWTKDVLDLEHPFRRIEVTLDGKAAYREWKESGEDDKTRSLPEGFQVDRGTHLRLS